jgi:hypothetical protein
VHCAPDGGEKAGGKYIVWLDADMSLVTDFMKTSCLHGAASNRCNSRRDTAFTLIRLSSRLENIVYAVTQRSVNMPKPPNYGYLPGEEGQSTDGGGSSVADLTTNKRLLRTQRWVPSVEQKAGN